MSIDKPAAKAAERQAKREEREAKRLNGNGGPKP